MGKVRKGVEVSIAIADAVAQANVDVIAAYPITPQTHIVEHLSEIVAEWRARCRVYPGGERAFRHECLLRLCCGGRQDIHLHEFTGACAHERDLLHRCSHEAAHGHGAGQPVAFEPAVHLERPQRCHDGRDAGWIHIFVENGQETYDNIFCAFRISEDPSVMLPVAINLDGFILTHMVEAIEYEDDELIKAYLPEFKMKNTLHPDKPDFHGVLRHAGDLYRGPDEPRSRAFRAPIPHILKAWEEWGKLTGRYYNPIETYRADDAEYCIVTMGSYSETAMEAVDALRDEGEKVGVIKIRLWRPFPFDEFRKAALGKKHLIVLDRAISFGGPGGPVASELRSALYKKDGAPTIVNYVAGLAGRDVSRKDFRNIILDGKKKAQSGRHRRLHPLRVEGIGRLTMAKTSRFFSEKCRKS